MATSTSISQLPQISFNGVISRPLGYLAMLCYAVSFPVGPVMSKLRGCRALLCLCLAHGWPAPVGWVEIGWVLFFFFFKLRCGYIYGVFEYVWTGYGVYGMYFVRMYEVSKRCIKTTWQYNKKTKTRRDRNYSVIRCVWSMFIVE